MQQLQLVEDNLKLVYKVAHKVKERYPSIEFEELVSMGNVGLVRAAQTFNPAKSNFSTHAYHYIRGHMLKEIYSLLGVRRKLNDTNTNTVSLDAIVTTKRKRGSRERRTYHDIAFSELHHFVVDIEDKVDLSRALRVLDDREKQVICLRYGLKDGIERTQKEVAKIMKLYYTTIGKIERNAIKKLRREVEAG